MKETKFVKVIASTFVRNEAKDMIGGIFEVKRIDYFDNTICIYNKDKSDYFWFNFSDCQEVTGAKFEGKDICVGDFIKTKYVYYKRVTGYYAYNNRIILLVGSEDTLTVDPCDIEDFTSLYSYSCKTIETIEIAGHKYSKKEVEEALKDIKEVK